MITISVIRKLVNFGVISLLGFNLFIGCVKLVPDLSETYTIDFQINLPLDYNGYYHLTIDRTEWQTLHRVSGVVKDGMNNMVEGFWVEWDSDLYWYLGDNSSYVVHYGFTDEWVKVTYDTTYVIGFTGLGWDQAKYHTGTEVAKLWGKRLGAYALGSIAYNAADTFTFLKVTFLFTLIFLFLPFSTT